MTSGNTDHFANQLVIVSNRLPVAVYEDETKGWQIKPSPGGLVTALNPIISRSNGSWIGWAGCSSEAPIDRLLTEYNNTVEYELHAVPINEDEIEKFYRGFSNHTIWPLFHDLLGHFSFSQENWDCYIDINQRFAEVVAKTLRQDSLVWIHDYQLLLAGHFLPSLGVQHHLNFFLHIPFPSVDIFRRLPWKQDLLDAILDYDHIGFQTAQDRRNFIQCMKWFKPEIRRTSLKRVSKFRYGDRDLKIGHYPISIDFHEFNDAARTEEAAEAAWYLHENLNSRVLVLGLDRLDYTKGIPERFLAFERMLEKYPETHTNISLIQIVIPSRLNVPDYEQLKSDLDSLAGRINARFSTQGWIPIHYQFRELDRTQLLGHYRACEIALITPLRDGMNLVAKEYCACTVDDNGVLILSEFAGAARQLGKGALLVNPYDIEGTADAIYSAYIMPAEESVPTALQKKNPLRRKKLFPNSDQLHTNKCMNHDSRRQHCGIFRPSLSRNWA
jgi:trehalose 6-phosphate synthase